ncbi:FkbM family methyltransferase [Thauera humireducens]|uniref:FkbM family methyltransferase n=1 Tax=Thauera humireducens TaxID=1134435 RepID=UPI002467A981|nr:FkbM family methyltransferase [Thauera humireducens]CAH1746777.1 FkbM family methyltransferase [Thauera humireducens]
MMFISYAQNFEDVMLWRALGHIERGFYIDVGANHPSEDSVTKAFYERGWSGINIEPLAKHVQQLQQERPRDLNLQVAVGAENGEIELFDTPVRGLATASVAVAQRHAGAGLQTVRSHVPLRRLDEICAEYAPADIHFLKIDVEGFEAEVLAGMDLHRYRPWVLLIEATVPNSNQIDASWEPQILAAGYQYVYFDGLNRYYVAAEHVEDLAPQFDTPPNVFDAFVTTDLVESREALRAAHAQLALAQEDLKAWSQRLSDTEQLLDAMRNSTSWRITAPLRDAVLKTKTLKRDVGTRGLALLGNLGQRMPRVRRLAGRVARALGVHAKLQPLLRAASDRQTSGPVFLGEGGDARWPRPNASALPLLPQAPQTARLQVSGDNADHRIRLCGHVEGHYSLAIVNRGLAVGLEQIMPGGVAFQPWHGTPYDTPNDLPALQAATLRAQFARRDAFECEDVVSIVHHYPIINDPSPASQRLIFFFWEETTVPAATIARLNAEFDGVLVAAAFVRRALINSGCRIPVFVVPLGMDHLVGPDEAPLATLKPAPGQPFRFLHVSSVFERKGPDILLRAYLDAFSGDDAVELYIKTFPNPHNRIADQLRELSAGQDNPPRVIIDEAPLDDAGMLALYRSAQSMVLPTRGEGFNLPAAEALALGLPLIVTGHGAHLDFATLANALLTPFRFSRARSHVSTDDACWASANPADLTRQMRQLRNEVLQDAPALAARRALGVQTVRSTYTWRACATAVQHSIDWLRTTSPMRTPRTLALVSPWQTRCGIAEYSRNLLSNLGFEHDWRLRVYCDSRTTADAEQSIYVPTWRLNDDSSVCATLDLLAEAQPDALLVQHQPSLFPLTSAVCCRLAAIATHGCIVVLELHSTQPLLADHRLSARSIAALRRIDRIVVHKEDDLNYLLALGLCDNVMLLTHGVVQPLPPEKRQRQRHEFGIPDDALVLGAFGFALPHKGGDALVAAVKPLANATGRTVHLLGLNSILDRRSEQTLDDWQKQARRRGVDANTTWITDYRPIEECQDILGLADYIVFPYRDTRESASGAVTIGLAAMRPVLVSPLDIFNDVSECTWQMSGHGADDIVAAVSHLESNRNLATQLCDKQSAWLGARDWRCISSRFAAMLDGLYWQRQLDTQTVAAPANETGSLRRLFVDISELYFRDARTGIQRVVRSVLSELIAAPPAGYEVCPVFAEKGHPWRHTHRYHSADIVPAAISEGQTVTVAAGDIFLGLDLGAHLFPEADAYLRDFRLAGARVFFVVYDIIPLRYPQYTVDSIREAFVAWLQGLARQADGLLCISAAVADDVRRWLNENAAPLPYPDVRHFHLGADIGSSLPTRGRPDNADATLSDLSGGPVFISVGTIEPRKGQEQTLDAFELLWNEGSNARLVLVGKEGWMMEEFVARLRSHPELGIRLFWLAAISDEFLEEVYARADCLIAASMAEGFGLPLIEAAQHGLPIIARDIPVFREIAGAHAYYFSGTRAADLERALRRWLALYESGNEPSSRVLKIEPSPSVSSLAGKNRL